MASQILTRYDPTKDAIVDQSVPAQVVSGQLAAHLRRLPMAPYPPGSDVNGYVAGPNNTKLPPPPDEAQITAETQVKLAAAKRLELNWMFWVGLGCGAVGLYWLGAEKGK